MVVLFSDGFEGGDTTNWTGSQSDLGNSISVVGTHPHSGVKNAQFVSTALTFNYLYKNIAGNPTTLSMQFWVYFETLPTTNGSHNEIAEICGASFGSDVGLLDVVSDGSNAYFRMHYSDGLNDLYVTDTTPLSTGVYYCVELFAVINAGAGQNKLYVNGTQIISVTGLDNTRYGNVFKAVGLLDDVNPAFDFTIDFDDVIVADQYIGLSQAAVDMVNGMVFS